MMPLPTDDPDPTHRIGLAAVLEAHAIVPPAFRDTPQYVCEPLGDRLGCRVTLKVETANPIRSFKGRGASVLVHRLVQRHGDAPRTPLVSASAGNWGQALAWACRDAGWPLVLYAARGANPLKVARMQALGADVRLEGRDFDDAKTRAAAFAAAHGHRFVADGFDVEASEGAATIALELLRHRDDLSAVLVPLGNGALLTGIGRWVKAVAPHVEVIGVSARGADAMHRAWRTGDLTPADTLETVADGIGVRVPIAEAVADMRTTVDDVVLVDDAQILEAMRRLHRDAGLVVEPSGAAGLAALLADPPRFAGRHVATPICGGNLTPQQVAAWLA